MTVDSDDKFEILSTNDEKIKEFGKLLSNDTSRGILNLIYEQEMTSLEIARKTGFSLELVRYHIQKMVAMGIIQISKIEKSSKEQDMKYYRVAKVVVIVLPHQVSDKMKHDKTVLGFFNKIYRFVAVGTAAVITWFVSQNLQPNTASDYVDWGPDKIWLEKLNIHGDVWMSIVATMSVIITGLLIINHKKLIQFKKIYKRN